jgi:hypothetical protein
VLFLNSGDTFESATILDEIFAPRRREGTAEILYGHARLKNTGEVLRAPDVVRRKFFFFETLCHQSVFARRSLFNRVGPFRTSYRVIADREWLLLAFDSGARFEALDRVVCRWDAVGFSSANADHARAESIDFQRRYFSEVARAVLPWRMRLLNLRRRIGRVLGKDRA